ncbi:MAG TPA: ribonuclease III [Clostridiales bacterium]|nr:ribonuclease III [Clostridiales bacterium]
MTDYFSLNLPEGEINSISSLGLAYLGDAVFELMVRSWLCCRGGASSGALHREAIKYVSAQAQAQAARRIGPELTDAEKNVFRRARNTKVHSVPQNADISDYHAATGLEALFGWLYLRGNKDRLNRLFQLIMEGE